MRKGRRGGVSTATDGFYDVHPTKAAKRSLANQDEPNFRRCQQCGLPNFTDEQDVCRLCGSGNWKK